MGMFDNYKKDLITDIPCNISKCIDEWEDGKILVNTINENCNNLNVFRLPFKYDSTMTNFIVTYYQFDKELLNITDVTIEECKDEFFILVRLDEEQSNLFEDSLLDTQVQIRFNCGEDVIVSEIINIEVKETLYRQGE